MALAALIVRIGADLTDLNKGLDQTDKDVQRLGKKMGRTGRAMTAGLTVPIVAGFAMAFKASEEQAQSMAKLNAVIDATGGAAGVTAQHVDQLASRLQKTTTFADDVTIAAAATLLTFKSVRNELGKGNNVFDRTIVAAQDMATVFGGDLQQSIVQLAKAVEDPIRGMSALRRVGVTFSNDQTAVIKALQESGDLLGAQKIILEALETQLGGTAAAMTKTAGGQMKMAMNALSHSAEKVGEIVAPIVLKVASALQKMAEGFAALSPETQKTIVVIAGLVATIGPLLIVVGKILTMLPLLKVAFLALTGPVGLVVAAIVGLTVVWLKWGDDIKRIVRETITAIGDWFGAKFSAIVDGIRKKIEAVTGFFKNMYDKVVGGSYVPDLIAGIAAQFALLDAVMVRPALAATAKVNAAFAGLKPAEITLTPTRPAGAEGDSTGSKFSQVIQAGGGGSEIGQMVVAFAQFGPLAALLPVINGALETLGPAFSAMIEPLKAIGRVIGDTLAPQLRLVGQILEVSLYPVLKLLSAVSRVVTVALSYFAEGLGHVIRFIGKLIDSLPFVSAKGIIRMGQEMIDAAQAARRNTDATEDATDAVNRFASSLSNIPRVLNINALRHMITGGPNGATPGNPGSPTGGTPRGGGGLGPKRPVQFSYGDIYITVPGAGDPVAVAESVGRVIERTRIRGGMSRLSLATT